jgi:hypothetical protein
MDGSMGYLSFPLPIQLQHLFESTTIFLLVFCLSAILDFTLKQLVPTSQLFKLMHQLLSLLLQAMQNGKLSD